MTDYDFLLFPLQIQKKVVPLHTTDPGTLPIRTVQHAGPFFFI